MAKKEGGIVGKTFADYWKVIQLPVIVLIVWNIIQTLGGTTVGYMYGALGAIGMLISLAAFLYIGWTAFKKFKFDLAQSAVAGAIAGVISGVVGLILMIIAGSMALNTFNVMGYGAPAAAAGGFVMTAMITIGIGAIIGGAIIGAILAAIGTIAAQNMK